MELFLVATLVSQCSHNTLIMVSVDVDKKAPTPGADGWRYY